MRDYKDISFSFNAKRAYYRRRRNLALALLLLLAGSLAWWQKSAQWQRLAAVQEHILSGRTAQAASLLERGGLVRLYPAARAELALLLALTRDDWGTAQRLADQAEPVLLSALVQHARFLDAFLTQGRCQALGLYAAYLLRTGPADAWSWHAALARTALYDPAGARRRLAAITPAFVQQNQKAWRIVEHTLKELESGRVTCVFDRQGQGIGYYDLRKGQVVSLLPGLALGEFSAPARAGMRLVSLTVDGALQRKVHGLFKNYSGSLVLVDLQDGGIACAYSRSADGGNSAWSERYEPGSIIKAVTLLAWFEAGLPTIFPLPCAGNMTLEGRIFYDWSRHGVIADEAAALASSCNLAFARMGLLLGRAALARTLGELYFNHADIDDAGLVLKTGQYSVAAPGEYALASLAVGLHDVSVTTYHAALLAALFAQNGALQLPFLVSSCKNVLQLGIYSHVSAPVTIARRAQSWQALKTAMAAVVDSPQGTGRRAAGAVRMAIKTGTAGDSVHGLDAMIMGYLPLDKPRYAFAFRLAGAGKSEIVGTAFLKALVPELGLQ
jgi:hypothetical protein